jgi:molybdopterin-binding protein
VLSDLTAVTQQYQSFVNGLGLLSGGNNNGSSEPYIEQLGVVTAALNEALVQDYDGLLRIAPAWPQGWDAEGTIYIQGNSKVDVQVQDGQVTTAIVEAGSTGMLNVRNAWNGQPATVVDGTANQIVIESDASSTLSVPITMNHWYAITPHGQPMVTPIVVTGTPATTARKLGPQAIGL